MASALRSAGPVASPFVDKIEDCLMRIRKMVAVGQELDPEELKSLVLTTLVECNLAEPPRKVLAVLAHADQLLGHTISYDFFITSIGTCMSARVLDKCLRTLARSCWGGNKRVRVEASPRLLAAVVVGGLATGHSEPLQAANAVLGALRHNLPGWCHPRAALHLVRLHAHHHQLDQKLVHGFVAKIVAMRNNPPLKSEERFSIQQLRCVVVEEVLEKSGVPGHLGAVGASGMELLVLAVEEPRLQALLASVWVFCCPRRHRFRRHVRRLVELMAEKQIGTPPSYYESFSDAFTLFEQLAESIPVIRRMYPFDVRRQISTESEPMFDENLLQTKEDFYWTFVNLMWNHVDMPEVPISSTTFLKSHSSSMPIVQRFSLEEACVYTWPEEGRVVASPEPQLEAPPQVPTKAPPQAPIKAPFKGEWNMFEFLRTGRGRLPPDRKRPASSVLDEQPPSKKPCFGVETEIFLDVLIKKQPHLQQIYFDNGDLHVKEV